MRLGHSLRRVYVASPIPTYATTRYDNFLAVVTEHHQAWEVIPARDRWRDNQDWRAGWTSLLDTLGALVAFGEPDGIIARARSSRSSTPSTWAARSGSPSSRAAGGHRISSTRPSARSGRRAVRAAPVSDAVRARGGEQDRLINATAHASAVSGNVRPVRSDADRQVWAGTLRWPRGLLEHRSPVLRSG